MLTSILAALVRINDNYGYGDIQGVLMDEDWKGGTVTVKRHSCHPETRRFRFNLATNTVYFARHQRNIRRMIAF